MKTIKIIENLELWDLELIETDDIRMAKFQIWFNGCIIDDAKTLNTALKRFEAKALKNNLITI